MVGLDRVALDFGEVRYAESITQSIQITNTGSVVAQYRLVPKPDETSVCKPWLTVAPMFGLLVPGEQPSNINLTITINRETAQQLNSGREVLDDVLILRLENGRDYYVTVKANFARSCFGMDVHELVLYSDPIRTIPLDPIERAKKMDASQNTALCVPKELWRIIDAIYEKGLEEPHLFVQPGIPEEEAAIRECLDTGKPFAKFWIHSYAGVLVSFLSSLSSPIIPASLFPAVEIDSQNIQMSARRLLEELTPIHYNVFVYVISFFREVLQLRERNLLTAAKIARICSSCMSPGIGLDDSNAAHLKRTGMQLIILHLLETVSI
jgi:phosphatidylinositol-bisphosphatase